MPQTPTIIERIVEWTRLKCRIQAAPERVVYFKEREIWWASIGANVGSEQNGKNELFDRPVLVLKKLNDQMLWAIPMTTSEKRGQYYFPTACGPGQKRQTAALSQIKAMSYKRLTRKQRVLPEEEFEEIRARLRKLL